MPLPELASQSQWVAALGLQAQRAMPVAHARHAASAVRAAAEPHGGWAAAAADPLWVSTVEGHAISIT